MDDFEVFVRARSAALARTAYLLTGDRQLAEDLLQDALARVAGRWASVARLGDPEPYVRRVLYTCAVDGWRRHVRRRRVEQTATEQRPELRGADDDAETVTRRLVLRDALARLTHRQRAVLVLRFYEDLTESQAADVLGCSVNTVKSQTRHALARLRELAPELGSVLVDTSMEGR
ncbi:SigE family RNA polymerase sigma factor [Dactylosporangium sp. NPDC048998]|uniref:SigE family RNA polymerase sigma factor n=1 Tax=Dactylosporangium sp. NPDC048998 TaxID=3363976 RepID=UPI0037156773